MEDRQRKFGSVVRYAFLDSHVPQISEKTQLKSILPVARICASERKRSVILFGARGHFAKLFNIQSLELCSTTANETCSCKKYHAKNLISSSCRNFKVQAAIIRFGSKISSRQLLKKALLDWGYFSAAYSPDSCRYSLLLLESLLPQTQT